MAHKKGVGSSRNGRDSNPKMLGVKHFDGELVTAGGRVLNVTGLGNDLAAAREAAYAAADMIEFRGKQLRRDIALHAA